jgi:Ca2+-binding EF-hand superfamily protein
MGYLNLPRNNFLNYQIILNKRDKSGSISCSELTKLFEKLGFHPSDDELEALLKQADTGRDGSIQFNEFKALMADQYDRKLSPAEIQKVFDYFDQDNSGFISVDELREAFKALGKPCTPNEFERMMSKIDQDGSGKISVDEFSKLVA